MIISSIITGKVSREKEIKEQEQGPLITIGSRYNEKKNRKVALYNSLLAQKQCKKKC